MKLLLSDSVFGLKRGQNSSRFRASEKIRIGYVAGTGTLAKIGYVAGAGTLMKTGYVAGTGRIAKLAALPGTVKY